MYGHLCWTFAITGLWSIFVKLLLKDLESNILEFTFLENYSKSINAKKKTLCKSKLGIDKYITSFV